MISGFSRHADQLVQNLVPARFGLGGSARDGLCPPVRCLAKERGSACVPQGDPMLQIAL